jgi:hypothetical protein
MYCRNPILDESAPVSSSSSSYGNTNEKSTNTLFAPAAEPTSTAIPGRHEENVSNWGSGYPQPLRFIPIA